MLWVLLGLLVVGAMLLGGLWLVSSMPGQSCSGELPPLTLAQREVAERLRRHVTMLAGEIGERHIWRPAALEQAAWYVEETLRGVGLGVAFQEFTVRGAAVRNIEAELLGTGHTDETVVLGAHYDSVIGSPGANDNASGVAALLELARLLSGCAPARTVRFVAFVNEEPPFFLTAQMGSRQHARRARERGERVAAMLSLETMGCYSERSFSQSYPFPFGLFYPRTGNFIGFVGNLRSRDLVRRCVRAFRAHARFPSEGAAAPAYLPGVFWSDHWSYWREGYPALMVTDTALFRYGQYHTSMDTPEKVDYARLARVVVGLAAVVSDLAGAGSPAT